MKEQLTLGSLFDGIGGFPFAATIANIKPIWAAEIEPHPIAVTKHHFPDMLHLGSVTDINGAEIPPVDIISFGSPCQDLSVAGKRAGLDGTRSGLFGEAVRIIYEMREATNGQYPTFAIWENVPGAFSSNKGRDFRTVLEEITKADIPMPASGKWANAGLVRGGAVCAAWRLLDAQYWGVPQRRKRIYLVASFGSDSAEQILFECDRVRGYLTPSGTPGQEIAADIGSGPAKCNSKIYDARGNGGGAVAPTVVGDHNSGVSDYSAVVVSPIICLNDQGFDNITVEAGGVSLCEEQTPTLTRKKEMNVICAATQQGGAEIYENLCPTITAAAGMSGNNQPYICKPTICMQGSMIGRADKNGPQGDGINNDLSFTLNTIDRHGVAYGVDCRNCQEHEELYPTLQAKGNSLNASGVTMYEAEIAEEIEWVVRRLTPLECNRLQGYPDNWTQLPKIEDMSDEDYNFFLNVFLRHKEINGQAVKKPPTKQSLIKWYNKLDCDGNRYKALGNSLAIPCALRILGGIADYVAKERSTNAT